MTLETATYINGLNATYPEGAAAASTADDHLRLIKSTVKASFPNVSGAMNASHTELNLMVGATKTVATALSALSLSVSAVKASISALQTNVDTISATVSVMAVQISALSLSVSAIGATAAYLAVEQVWTAQQTPMGSTLSTSSSASSTDWDCDVQGQILDLIVAAGVGTTFTLANPTNVVNKTGYVLRVTQNGTSARAITWGSGYLFQGGTDPALSTSLGSVDIFSFIGGPSNVMHCVGIVKGLS